MREFDAKVKRENVTRKKQTKEKKWEDDITKWTAITSLWNAENRELWRRKVMTSSVATQRSKRLSDR